MLSTVHVLSLALFIGTAAMLDLRLLGATMRDVRVSEVVERLFPWTVTGFLLMAGSGAMLFSADPVTYYGNVIFRIKMGILVLAVGNASIFHLWMYRRMAAWDQAAVPPAAAKAAGAVSLVLWAALVMAGRMVYYDQYWFR